MSVNVLRFVIFCVTITNNNFSGPQLRCLPSFSLLSDVLVFGFFVENSTLFEASGHRLANYVCDAIKHVIAEIRAMNLEVS